MPYGDDAAAGDLPVFAKTCSACLQRRWASEFSENPKSPDGLQNRCKDCRRAWFREYNAEHPERHAAAQARSYQRRKATRRSPGGSPP